MTLSFGPRVSQALAVGCTTQTSPSARQHRRRGDSRESLSLTPVELTCVVSSCPACQTTSTALLNHDCDLPRRARHVRRSTDSACDTTIEAIGCRAKDWTSTGYGPTVGRRDVVTSETVDRPVRWLPTRKPFTHSSHPSSTPQHSLHRTPPCNTQQQDARTLRDETSEVHG